MGPLVTNAMQDRDDVFTLAQIDNFTELDNQIAVLKIWLEITFSSIFYTFSISAQKTKLDGLKKINTWKFCIFWHGTQKH